MSKLPIAIAGGVGAAAVANIVNRLVRSDDSLLRTNHKGKPVSLSEGIGVATAMIGSAVARWDLPAAAALTATANAGLADDLEDLRTDGDKPIKGFKGHLGALKQGRVTTGVLKIAVIGSASLGYAVALNHRHDRNFYDLLIDTTIIAGSADISNLFDLRPGRSLKMSGACATFANAFAKETRAFGATLGAICGAAPSDLAGETMLGDVGANTLGLQVGMIAAAPNSRAFRTLMAALTVGIVGAAEVVSFSKLIDSSPTLTKLDQLGVKQGA